MTSAFFGLSTFPGWHEEHDPRTGSDIDIKPFPSRTTSLIVALELALGSLLWLTAGLWQHVAAAAIGTMLSSTAQGDIDSHVGAAAVALVWVCLALVSVSFVGIVVMIMSISMLYRLTDED